MNWELSNFHHHPSHGQAQGRALSVAWIRHISDWKAPETQFSALRAHVFRDRISYALLPGSLSARGALLRAHIPRGPTRPRPRFEKILFNKI